MDGVVNSCFDGRVMVFTMTTKDGIDPQLLRPVRVDVHIHFPMCDEFAFSTFFPEFLRPVINPIASIFHRMFCGRSDTSTEAKGYVYGDAPLSGSDPIEASRRRERGARALEERLAAERLAAARRADDSHIDASDQV